MKDIDAIRENYEKMVDSFAEMKSEIGKMQSMCDAYRVTCESIQSNNNALIACIKKTNELLEQKAFEAATKVVNICLSKM